MLKCCSLHPTLLFSLHSFFADARIYATVKIASDVLPNYFYRRKKAVFLSGSAINLLSMFLFF